MSEYSDEQRDAITRAMRDDAYIPFDGQNCDDDCAGWDGEDRRCSCGNRRVAWDFYHNAEGTLCARAEAF